MASFEMFSRPKPRQAERGVFFEPLRRLAMSDVIVTQIGGRFGAGQYEIQRDASRAAPHSYYGT
jgi:hypothetical protein